MDYVSFFVVLISVGAVVAGLLWFNHILAKKRVRLAAKANAKLSAASWKQQAQYAEKILNDFPVIMKKMVTEMTGVVNDM